LVEAVGADFCATDVRQAVTQGQIIVSRANSADKLEKEMNRTRADLLCETV
jgi:hypothetical protein